VEVWLHSFLDSTLASRPGRFTRWEGGPGTHWIGGWMSPRTCVDDLEKRKICCSSQGSKPECPARSLSHQFDYAFRARYSLRIVQRWANLFTQRQFHTKMLLCDCSCVRGCERDWSTIKSQRNAATLRWYSRQRFPLSWTSNGALRNSYISQHLSPQIKKLSLFCSYSCF
jgi:hypothetical protein